MVEMAAPSLCGEKSVLPLSAPRLLPAPSPFCLLLPNFKLPEAALSEDEWALDCEATGDADGGDEIGVFFERWLEEASLTTGCPSSRASFISHDGD